MREIIVDNHVFFLKEDVLKEMIKKPVFCADAGPGHGLCDRCAEGRPELCRYMMTPKTAKEIDRLLELEKYYAVKAPKQELRKQLWTKAWCSCCSSCNCTSADICTSYADKAVEEFDKRFREE